MFLHKDYIKYSIETLKKFVSLKSVADSNVQEMEKFLGEMKMHVENSIKEAVSHNSSYAALVDIMSEHPRGQNKPVKLKKWAIDLMHQLKELDSTADDIHDALESYKKHKTEHENVSHLLDRLKKLSDEMIHYENYSSKFANSLAKEEEALDHIDHQKVKSEVVDALQNKKHLSQVYVNNIISWF
jgi:hypothetical protein